jgi:hypothetical protein
MNLADANPISVPSVPDVQISYPLSSLDGYVNSTVEFEIYVNMFIDSPAPSNISYSLDGEPSVDLEDFEATTYYDYGPDKIDFKTYEASVILKDLSEGNHTLVAYANGMSAHRDFTVNSHYEIAVLKVLSPAGQAYTETVPLIFSVNGEILNAHYYLYRGNELVLDRSLSGNTTLGNLSLGSYDMYLFVTTEDGQTSARIPFSMVDYTHLGENLPIVAGVTVLILVSVAAGLLVSSRRAERGQESLTAA